jgi:hypothetical protein
MMAFDKHRKAIIAQTKVISTLVSRDFDIFLPIGDHLPFDLIAYKDGISYRIQSKYAGSGFLNKNTYWYSKNTVHKKQYQLSDFDFYGAYLPEKDIVIFPSSKFAGCTIASTMHKSPTPFYWYEDFINFTETANKKNYLDFGMTSKDASNTLTQKGLPRLRSRKVDRPSREELEKLVWEFPSTQLAIKYGVSDVSINKWCNAYGINKPPRGFWKKSAAIIVSDH